MLHGTLPAGVTATTINALYKPDDVANIVGSRAILLITVTMARLDLPEFVRIIQGNTATVAYEDEIDRLRRDADR